MAKEFVISIVGKTGGAFTAETPEEAVEKYIKQLMYTVYDEANKEFTDLKVDADEKLTLIKSE